MVHAISAASVRASTLGGCTEIEHGMFATQAELTLMAEHGTIYDPQVCLVLQNYVDHKDVFKFSDAAIKTLADAIPVATTMFRHAIATPRLKIIFGTDAVALAHGHNVEELVCRVRNAGQKPMDAIVSATSAAASRARTRESHRSARPGARRGPDRRGGRSVEGDRGAAPRGVRDARRRGVSHSRSGVTMTAVS